MFDWERHKVCFAEGPPETFVALAVRPTKVEHVGGPGETVTWDDGSHERAFEIGRIVRDEPARFEFVDHVGRRLWLVPLTARLYTDRVRELVHGPELKTDKDVRAFYLQPRSW